jgi:hypothetical protein
MAIKDAIKVRIGCISDNDITAQIPLIEFNGMLLWFIKYNLNIVHLLELHLHLFQIILDVQQ